MARVFITGSSDGLGLMAAKLLIEQGHEVVVHGRNDARRVDALRAASKAKGGVSGDLSTIAGARSVGEQANKLGRFDAVIHNAGVGYREPQRVETERGAPNVFAVNVLAPYILTALIERPDRLIYLSSGMHHSAAPRLDDLLWTKRPWSGSSAYAESKLCDVLLAFAVARRWPNVMSNALEPGWVPTKYLCPSWRLAKISSRDALPTFSRKARSRAIAAATSALRISGSGTSRAIALPCRVMRTVRPRSTSSNSSAHFAFASEA